MVLVDSKKIQGEKSKLQVCALIYSLVNVFSIRLIYKKYLLKYLNIYIFTLEIIPVAWVG